MSDPNSFRRKIPPANPFKMINRTFTVIAHSGLSRLMQIGYIQFIEPKIMMFVPWHAKFSIYKKRIWNKITAKWKLARLSQEKSKFIQKGGNEVSLEDLGLNEDGLRLVKEKAKAAKEVVIANIDQDGFYLSHFGPIDGIPCIDEENFLPRIRFSIDLVLIDGVIGVKKNYCGNAASFLTELEILHTLSKSGCNVPTILDADFKNYSLTISFIAGAVIREQLASKGSILRDRDVNVDLEFTQLPPKSRWFKRIEEGKRYLHTVVDGSFVEGVYDQILKIHSANIYINDIKYGNVIIEKKSGKPYLIDFESAMDLTGMNQKTIKAITDCDIELFNLHFGTDKPTYERLKRKIENKEYPFPGKWYAPAYLGAGLKIGALWSPEVGWGRWQYILKDNLPNVTGYRVLDLGANNGFNSLQLLRSGAREAIGFEIDPDAIEQGMFLKSAMEWSDGQKFNFRYIQSSMADLVSMDLGSFDLVLALCSIYYLEDDEITRLIRHISSITNCFIVQGNIESDIGRENIRTYEKASVGYLKDALENNGFPQVRVIAPKGYSRPLLIAQRQ